MKGPGDENPPDMLSQGQEYRRGWPVLLASAVGSGVGLAPIAAYSLGALIAPLVSAFGWTRAQVGAAALFQAFGMLIAGAVAGGLADRYGARPVALISQLLLAIALAGLSLLTPQVWSLHLGYFVLAILGAGTLPMIWGRAIVGWFFKSRGLALGLSLFGTGIVGALMPSYVNALVGAFGWRGAYLGMAALPLVLGLPICLVGFREPPNGPRLDVRAREPDAAHHGHTFGEAIGTLCFWQMSAALVIVAIAVSGILVHALPLLTDRGVSRQTAAAIAGLFGIAVIFGRLVSGYFLDLFKSPVVGAVLFAAPAVACAVLTVSGANLPLSAAAILCCGLSAGAESDVAAYLVAKYFGRRNYAAVYGLLYTLFGIGGGLGPVMVGAVFDKTGSYAMALAADAAAFLLAALLIATVRSPRPARPSPLAILETVSIEEVAR
jgi:MFS family permease